MICALSTELFCIPVLDLSMQHSTHVSPSRKKSVLPEQKRWPPSSLKYEPKRATAAVAASLSCFNFVQIRMGGYKGMLAVWPDSVMRSVSGRAGYKVLVRPSMDKFASERTSLEVNTNVYRYIPRKAGGGWKFRELAW